MNYDSFSVHDLVCEALALQERAQLMGDREPFTDAMLSEIESFIKKAVIREASVETCEWVESEEGVWDTSCEETFVFEEGDPEENNSRYCCYCGKPIKAVPFVYPTEEETP